MQKEDRRNLMIVVLLLLLLLLLGFFVWWRKAKHGPAPVLPPLVPPVQVSTSPPVAVLLKPPPIPMAPKQAKPAVPKPTENPAPAIPFIPAGPTPAPAPVTAPSIPPPPHLELHKELIPKNIEIVRCYYNQEIVAPETTFGFDINGTGFTQEFGKMITVDPGGLDIEVKNLRLVTANQIHGDMVVGSEATTEFIYPRVLIHNLPVFRAPDPFAVVRPGEVLIIVFTSLDETGRSGRFRVITNLDETMAKNFSVQPSTGGLEISDIQTHLPFAVEGTLTIGQHVPQGEYGLKALLNGHPLWNRDNMIRIVRPNVGLTGFVQGISAEDPYHRPGDTVQIYLQGSGLTPSYVSLLDAKIDEFDMGSASFTYISPAEMRFSFQSPRNAPLQSYGVTVMGQHHDVLYKKKDVFALVPPEWVAGVQVVPPVAPGQKSALKVIGRDLSAAFAQGLHIDTDEPGIHISTILPVDASTLAGQITVDASVAPGDYLLTLSSNGKPIKPQFGSLIKVIPK